MYDFDEIIERRNTCSNKWDNAPEGGRLPDDVLPMWVADMDFACPPQVVEAIHKVADQRIFGYSHTPDEYYETVCEFYRRRHGFRCSPEQIVFTAGVVSALNFAVRALTVPGDHVIVQTPSYPPFFSSVEGNGRTVVDNPLIYDNGRYSIDFEDLEKKAADPAVKMMIICSPHNPTGRVWTEDELRRTEDICLRNRLILVSDEIHNDLIRGGNHHISVMELFPDKDNIVCCTAPSKTFNIAGLGASHCFCPNSELREKISKEVGRVRPTLFTAAAVMEAFTSCDGWIDEMNAYTDGNFECFYELMNRYFPKATVTKAEGTYLAWVDVRAYTDDTEKLEKDLLEKCHVYIECGDGFHGKGFLRINLGCPRAYITEAFDRVSRVFKG